MAHFTVCRYLVTDVVPARDQNDVAHTEHLTSHSKGKALMEQPVFLSYRRKDQIGYVARLADDLNGAFGVGVFRDVESILAGENWQQVLKRKVSQAKVVIGMANSSVSCSLRTLRLFNGCSKMGKVRI